ncbi:hypothetical protein AZE42_12317 [Rhizopogon vesiculosus]|uniref:Uncharacterized protein n=1 Tax=Rhizopogon vesiculosus TaxID=180088 RepID=A0A1J8Q0S2_9AGAM|nr:hypothetical protein AZE42_12317 [Rhizopogon vesiculosus]
MAQTSLFRVRLNAHPLAFMTLSLLLMKAVQLEIRASFEHGCLGRDDLLDTVQTTLEELLLHAGKQFGLPVISAQCPSLSLRVKRAKAPQLLALLVILNSVVGRITDTVHEAYTRYRRGDHPKYLNSAIQGFQEVFDECLEDHPHRSAALSNLSHAIIRSFTKGVRTDINHAIFLFRHAQAQAPTSSTIHPQPLHLRHSMGKGSSDLHEAVVLCRFLLPLCLEDGHLHLHSIEQCNALPRNPSDESIRLRRTVLEHCRPRHPHRAR